MRKTLMSDRQGLVVRAIRPEAQGNSVYSFPHVYISQKLLISLKLKWGQSIYISTGSQKKLKCCKAYVFVEENLGNKEAVASSKVCKQLSIHEKDTFKIEMQNHKSPETLRNKKSNSPHITLALSEGIQYIKSSSYIYGKNSEMELVAQLSNKKLKIQSKQFREMKVYMAEVESEIDKHSPSQLFELLRNHNFTYCHNKKAVLLHNNLQIKLKKCPNTLRYCDNEILFHALRALQTKLERINDPKQHLKVETTTQADASESTQETEQGIENETKPKYKNNKIVQQKQFSFDFQTHNELLKLKKKIKQIDYKVEHIKAALSQSGKNPSRIFKEELDPMSKVNMMNTMNTQIEELTKQMKAISNKTLFSYIIQKEDYEEISLRMEKVQSEVNEHKEKGKHIERYIQNQVKGELEKTKKFIEGLNETKANLAKQISMPSDKFHLPLSTQKIKIDFSSKYIGEFMVEGNKIVRIGSKGWTQLLCTNIVPTSTITRYSMKILESKYNFVMFGLIHKDYKEERSSWTCQNSFVYLAWNGNVYIEGQSVIKQGRGFNAGQVVSMQVNLEQGVIKWMVNNEVVFEAKRQRVKKCQQVWVPYIEMFNPGDSLQLVHIPQQPQCF